LFALTDHPVLHVQGKDTPRYLRSRLTQELRHLSTGEGVRSLMLSPQGRIEGLFTVLRAAEDFFLIGEGGEAMPLLAALLRFRVADQVFADHLPWQVLTCQGNGARHFLERYFNCTLSEKQHAFTLHDVEGQPLLLCRRERGVREGYDLIGPERASLKSALIAAGAGQGSSECLEMLRIAARQPLYGQELSEKIFGAEIDLKDLVSFTKGCYTGQELIEMTRARGEPNKKLHLLRSAGSESLHHGLAIFCESDSAKPIGFVTSSCVFPGRNEVLSLAFLKSSSAPPFVAGGARIELLADGLSQ
jgi:folate-binding protein YgfZ